MVYVGLVTRSRTPSAEHAPRTNVVLPVPSSPATVTTSPCSSRDANAAASASVSSGELVTVSATLERLRLRPALAASHPLTTKGLGERGAFDLAGVTGNLQRVKVRSTFTRSEEPELLRRRRGLRDERELRLRDKRAAEQLRDAREVGLEHLQHRGRVQRG